MRPLERMATAIDEQITQIYGSPPDRGEGAKIARAALLALAEAELPANIIGAGAAKIAGVRTQHGDGRHLWEARAAFPTMCRAIAEDRG